MDEQNLEAMLEICPGEYQQKVSLFLSLINNEPLDVPDPYYGGDSGFSNVLDLIEAASDKLIERLIKAA